METANPKFAADDMVGKLAKWLRILGHDTLYFHRVDDRRLLDISIEQNRILLTRDTALAARKLARNCLLLTDDDYMKQLVHVMKKLDLSIDRQKVFTRCLICNTPLDPISKKDVEFSVPQYVFKTQQTFTRCRDCGRIYWSATHASHVEETLKTLALVLE
jgi:uncharacterized protein